MGSKQSTRAAADAKGSANATIPASHATCDVAAATNPNVTAPGTDSAASATNNIKHPTDELRYYPWDRDDSRCPYQKMETDANLAQDYYFFKGSFEENTDFNKAEMIRQSQVAESESLYQKIQKSRRRVESMSNDFETMFKIYSTNEKGLTSTNGTKRTIEIYDEVVMVFPPLKFDALLRTGTGRVRGTGNVTNSDKDVLDKWELYQRLANTRRGHVIKLKFQWNGKDVTISEQNIPFNWAGGIEDEDAHRVEEPVNVEVHVEFLTKNGETECAWFSLDQLCYLKILPDAFIESETKKIESPGYVYRNNGRRGSGYYRLNRYETASQQQEDSYELYAGVQSESNDDEQTVPNSQADTLERKSEHATQHPVQPRYPAERQ